jgi:hypothetical protein
MMRWPPGGYARLWTPGSPTVCDTLALATRPARLGGLPECIETFDGRLDLPPRSDHTPSPRPPLKPDNGFTATQGQ